MEKKFLTIDFKASYSKIGSKNHQTKNIWLIFHGYGQLSEEFSKSFSPLISDENILLFPQGLSKFYLKGVDRQIGASWMTSYERELDIGNYTNYLDRLFEYEVKPFRKNIKLCLLGFSQGGHTASRWISNSNVNYDKLILWGSGLAYEIGQSHIKENFSSGKNVIVVGDQDRFIDSTQLMQAKRRYSKIGFKYKLIEYHGGHDILPDVLADIV